MLRNLVCTFCFLGLAACGSAKTEPETQPIGAWYYSNQTTQPGNLIVMSGTSVTTTVLPACGQPTGGTGMALGEPEIVYETPETPQALAASGITVTPTAVQGRDFRLNAIECLGVTTRRLLIRGSRMGQGAWHVRIISANSDCSSDLVIAVNGYAAHYLPSASSRRCAAASR